MTADNLGLSHVTVRGYHDLHLYGTRNGKSLRGFGINRCNTGNHLAALLRRRIRYPQD